MLHEEMNALSLDSDWRPLPPTPTSRHYRESKPKKQLCVQQLCNYFLPGQLAGLSNEYANRTPASSSHWQSDE